MGVGGETQARPGQGGMKEGRQSPGESPEQPAKGAAVLCPPPPKKKKKSPAPKWGRRRLPGEGREPSSTLAVGGRAGGTGPAVLYTGGGARDARGGGGTEIPRFCPGGSLSASPPQTRRQENLSGPADALLTVTVGASGEGAGRGRRPAEGLRLGKLTSILGGTRS